MFCSVVAAGLGFVRFYHRVRNFFLLFFFRGGSGINNWISIIHCPIHVFSELFIIPYSNLLDILYSVSSLSGNFSYTDVAIRSTLY